MELESEEIAFILDRQVLALVIRLEDLRRRFNLPEICFHRRASYVQLGFSVYAGNCLCNARAHILVWQAYPVHATVGVVYAQTGWNSGR